MTFFQNIRLFSHNSSTGRRDFVISVQLHPYHNRPDVVEHNGRYYRHLIGDDYIECTLVHSIPATEVLGE